MKKIALFLLLACASITVSGCNEKGAGGANHFKEFSFTGTVDQEQRTKIEEGILKNAENLRSIVMKVERHQKSALSKTVTTAESTTKLLDDPSNMDLFIANDVTTMNREQTSDGITLKQKAKIETKQWDGGNQVEYTYTVSTVDGVKKETTSTSPISDASVIYKKATIVEYISTFSDEYTLYKNSDGSFAAIRSDVSKTVSGVQWGAETKEYIEESKSQTVYSISKDYRLINTYSYEEMAANRDQETGEWLSSVQVYSRSYASIDYKYGTRDKGSINDLNKLITA